MKYNKTIIGYSIISCIVFILSRIYGLFSHGVSSPWMSNAFLYVLVCGAGLFLLIKFLAPKLILRPQYRLFFNLYNTGLALLADGMILKGIIEIAGGSSLYTEIFVTTGWVLLAVSLVILIIPFRPFLSSRKIQ